VSTSKPRPDRPKYPFQADGEQLSAHLDEFVDTTVESLSSFYLELPRGGSFLEYDRFKDAYKLLHKVTKGFTILERHTVHEAARQNGLILVVLRCMVGLSPPELADLATETLGVVVDQGFARTQDAEAKRGRNILAGQRVGQSTIQRLHALLDAALEAIEKGPKHSSPLLIHRLDKVDTASGLESVHNVAAKGVPYPALLYERMLGRPFASHQDSVSSQVGDVVEDAVIRILTAANVPFYRPGQGEAIPGFDQAPDFLIPGKEGPKAVIEAKLTQDDGTARDKITRIQHIDRLSQGGTKYEVIACIDGRGFRIRRNDMKKLLLATRGKVFTVETMSYLIEQTSLRHLVRTADDDVGGGGA
jgi:hypothetical protein